MFKFSRQNIAITLAAVSIFSASQAYSGQGYGDSIGEAEQKSSDGYSANRIDAYADDVNGPLSKDEIVAVLKKQKYSNVREVVMQSGIYSVVAVNKQGNPMRLRISGYTGEVLFGQPLRKKSLVALSSK